LETPANIKDAKTQPTTARIFDSDSMQVMKQSLVTAGSSTAFDDLACRLQILAAHNIAAARRTRAVASRFATTLNGSYLVIFTPLHFEV
jgi:hypothetical protein